ncbi:MAG: hypothetical protein L6R45_13270 [Anaerolineae bacterium]|nr:hypothetical protein [Anaerolineae bacterium]
MKKVTVFAGLVILLFPFSLLTVPLATAKTVTPHPAFWAEPVSAIPLKAASSAPDAFGYTYQDETEIDGPTFGFIDISGTGTNLGLGDEGNANIPGGALTGFDFAFYDLTLSDLLVSNNGVIQFNAVGGTIGANNACPLSGGPNNIIAPWWDDWGNGGDVFWEIQGSAPNRRLIVQWNNMEHDKVDANGGSVTFEAVLFETSNLILFQYQDTTAGTDTDGTNLDFGNGGSIGIRRNAATLSLQYEGCNAPVLANDRAIRFQHTSLTITKDANPSPDPQNFSFAASFTTTTILLDDDAEPSLPNISTFALLPTSGYTVTENLPPATWGLSNLACVSELAAVAGFTGATSSFTPTLSTRTVEASLAPGDNLTCTFTNQNFGTIIITKATQPISDTQVFSFTSDIPGNLSFALDTDTGDPTQPISQTFTNLTPGDYFVQEDALSSWDLTDLTCADPSGNTTTNLGTRLANINVAAGETVSCTFTNTKRGTIVIQKDANPTGDPQVFTYTTTIPGSPTFTLDADPGSVTPTNSITLTDVASGTYTVEEDVVSGWDLTDLTCDDGSPVSIIGRTATIGLTPGETVVCTFTNIKRGIINITKDSLPNHAQDFTFTVTSSPSITIPPFSLDDDPGDLTLPVSQTLSVATGLYTLTEGAVANWSVSDILCVDPTADSGADPASRTAALNVAPGETIDCTFTNLADDGNLIVEKVTIPAVDPQVFTFTTSIPTTPTFTLDTNAGSATPVSQTLVISTGIYSVDENSSPNWDLTGVACNDGSLVDNIDVAPGEIVTCTFTNTKRATLMINKVTTPSNDAQDFAFTSNIPGNTAFSLDTDSGDGSLPASQIFLIPFGVYTVTEAALTGWDLADLSCIDNVGGSSSGDTATRTATIDADPGETIICTFTNAKLGTITVVKDAVPDFSQDFAFTSNIPGNLNFSLDDDPGDGTLPNSQTFPNLVSGSYLITETLPVADWSLTSITCVDPTGNSSGNTGTGVATVNVAPSETITCTFTNQADPGTIIIEKIAVANPANDPQDFSFTATGPTPITAFQLDDDGAAGNPFSNTITLSGLTPGMYTITEGTVAGWDVSSLTCDDGDSTGNIGTRTATIIVAPAETVRCTFTNTKRGIIIINKATDPTADPQDFTFTSTITGSANFALDTDTGNGTLPISRTFTAPPGSYSVTETAVTGWDLTDLTCADTVGGGSSGNVGTRTATINVSAGETIDCTFTNTAQPGSIVINKNAIPNDPQDFGYLLTGVSTNTVFALDDDSDGTLPSSRTFSGLPHGSYTVIEGATSNWALTNLTCNDPTGNTTTSPGFGLVNVALGPGETVNCTFTNTFNNAVGSITIVKSAVPTSTQSFTFTGALGAFSLVDDGTPPNSRTVLNLSPGSYAVTESAVTGWSLSGLTCADPDGGSTTNLSSRTSTIDLDAGENVTCTFTNTVATPSTTVYLPIILRDSAAAADLVITNFTVTGSNPNRVVTVVIQNAGNTSTGEGFWVDFYVNPTTLPNNSALGGNRRWERTGSSQGIAWPVPALAAGASVTLTSNGQTGTIAPAPAPLSQWTGSLPSGTNRLYAFVDSFDAENASFVEISESNENNNLASLTVIAAAGTEVTPSALPDLSQLPPRWEP